MSRALALLAIVAVAAARPHVPKPAWRLGDAKGKLEDLGRQMAHSDLMREKPNPPAHIVTKARAAVEKLFPERAKTHHVVKDGKCGDRVSTAAMGIDKKRLVALMAGKVQTSQHLAVLLAARANTSEHPGADSFSRVGSGGTQTVKDEGRSKMGQVMAPSNGEMVEPYVKVLKDGFFEVGCFADAMLSFYDKYGNDKDQYTDATNAQVAVVKYKELVLKEKEQLMTPTVCFEFCRTLPDMVFFGIRNGDECYCAPYYKPMPADGAQCTVPCLGDASQMCGNKVKSSIFEMHLCADTEGRLKEAMVKAKTALDFYFEEAVLTNTLGSQMTRSGKALEKVAGMAGSPEATQCARTAQVGSAQLTKGYKPSFKTYNELLDAYSEAVKLQGSTFADSADANMAELSVRTMGKTTGPVMDAAAGMHKTAKLVYPNIDNKVFGDDPDTTDAAAVALYRGKNADYDFRPAAYAFDTKFKSAQSACWGEPVSAPLVGLGIKECARVCEATVHPVLCRAFAFYAVHESEQLDGKGLSDLCFMFSDIKKLQTYACEDNALLQHGNLRKRGTAKGNAQCMVKMSEVATGYRPDAAWKKATRCFGEEDTDTPDAYNDFKTPVIAKMELDGKDTIAPPP